MRTIIFHPHEAHEGIACTYTETRELIENPQEDFVQTSQMCFLNSSLFDKGFTFVLIFEKDGNICISIDDAGQIYCPNTQRQLTKGHNLFKLWLANEFMPI